MKIKKGDKVQVLSGKEKGKTGKVERVLPKKDRAVVAGVNIAKKMVKPSKKAPKGGQIEFPAAIHISNLRYICPTCEKPTKITYKKIEGPPTGGQGKKLRVCTECQKSEEEAARVKEKPGQTGSASG